MKVEVSIGEAFDKLSILDIKESRIQQLSKLENIKKEKSLLQINIQPIIEGFGYIENRQILDKLYLKLKRINEELWDIEDSIRKKESKQEFDDEFIQLARKVYFTNDQRSKVKHEINMFTGSDLLEEKSYEKYN